MAGNVIRNLPRAVDTDARKREANEVELGRGPMQASSARRAGSAPSRAAGLLGQINDECTSTSPDGGQGYIRRRPVASRLQQQREQLLDDLVRRYDRQP